VRRLRWLAIPLAILAGVFSLRPLVALADAALTITPITWNVVGLDSNDVNVGPNNFPVGARVCNTGDAPATNVSSSFVWETPSDPYINSRPGSLTTLSVPTLAPAACTDFYFEAQVTRNPGAYNHFRRYYITATADGLGTVSTPRPREIFVEHLISQSRNATTDVRLNGVSIPAGGTMSLLVGNTYTITLVASTATNGYNQIETFINFPNTIFQVLSVQTAYSADTSPYVSNPDNRLYGDGCLWDNDPNSPTYRSCIGVDGKAGGNITVTYQIRIIGGGGTTQTLNSLIYDFSGSSYHYNADFAVSSRIAAIVDPASVTIAKAFTPNPSIVGGTSTLTFTLRNPNGVAMSGVSFADTFPTSPGAMVVANPAGASTSGCGSPAFAPSPGAASISFSNGTIAANGTCTVSVNVTTPATGTYDNISGPLFIGTVDTGNTASASLVVGSTPPAPPPVCGLTMAQWNFTGISNPPPQPAPSTQAPNVATAAISLGGTSPGSLFDEADATSGSPAPSLLTYGWPNAGPINTATFPFIQFTIDTRNYTQVQLQFDAERKSNGPNNDAVYVSTNGISWTLESAFLSTTSWAAYGPFDFTGQTSATGVTYFRIYGYGANTPSKGADLSFDDVTFTGCATPAPPTITKAFSPNPIAVGGSSTLTFTLTNPNSVALTGVTFTDALPTGLEVASTPAAGTTCGGAPTWAPAAGATTLTFGSPTGATIAAGGSCTAQVNITATTAGPHANVSGYVSATESGPNTGPGGSASASLTALVPPTVSKQFAPNPVLVNTTSTLTFTLSNPNPNDALTGVSFTDDLPLNLSVPTPPAGAQCGGTVTSALVGGLYRITLTGGTLAAGGSCTVTVEAVSSTPGSYANTSGAVSANIVGAGNTASDTLLVQPVHPGVSILKRVSTAPSGPWTTFVGVAAGVDVYYQFTVENTGDVPLTSVNVTDPTLAGLGVDLSGCAWASMPLYDVQTCVVGPVTALTGAHPNTATAHGTYSATVYNSAPSTASYATTGLTLAKSVAEGYFSAAGDVLHYSFLVTNSGSAPLAGPVTVSDDRSADEACPSVDTVGDLDAFLDAGESITCIATYTVTAADVTAGSATNTASAAAGGVTSNTDSQTVYLNLPELGITKANSTSGAASLGVPFTWSLTVTNLGPLAATFSDGQTIVGDPLPAAAAYGAPTPGGFTNITNSANISCAIDGSNVLACSASGAAVTIGATTGSFAVTIVVTPTAMGGLANTATVDPDGLVAEADEGNNSSSDTVTVGAPNLSAVKSNDAGGSVTPGTPFTWTVEISNATGAGIGPATFASGERILLDNLPAGPAYGAVTVTNGATPPGGTGSPSCSIASLALTCTASGGSVTLSPGASFRTAFSVTPASAGALANPAGGGRCEVDPDALISETSEADNACSDTVTAVAPPSISKSFTPDPIAVGETSTLTFTITNPNSATGLAGIAFTDTLPAGLTVASSTTPQCGGTLAVTTPDTIALSGGSLAAGSSCTFDLTVTGTSAGLKSNTTGAVSSTNGGTGNTASDTLNVIGPPSIAKAFTPTAITVGGTSTLTFSITNPVANTVALTGVAFGDSLPSGLQVAASPNASTSGCGSPTFVPAAGDTALAFGGGTIPVAGTCTVAVDITATTTGTKVNTSGNVSSTNGGTGNAASDTLTVSIVTISDPAVTKTTDPATAQVGDTVTFTLVVRNDGTADADNVILTDPVPAFLDVSSVDVTPAGPSVGIVGNTVTVDFTTLSPSESYTVTITTIVNSLGAPPGGTNTASVATTSGDANPANNASSAPVTIVVVSELPAPATGFAPGRTTALPEQPEDIPYSNYGDLWIEIPALRANLPIVGVPLNEDGWDVAWLGGQAGYLNGTAFPTWNGNSVITGHATLPSGLNGPFAGLRGLRYGDVVVVHAWGMRYVYEVRETELVRPNDPSVFRHEELAWVTLVTCQGYDERLETYRWRRVVRAVLVRAESGPAADQR